MTNREALTPGITKGHLDTLLTIAFEAEASEIAKLQAIEKKGDTVQRVIHDLHVAIRKVITKKVKPGGVELQSLGNAVRTLIQRVTKVQKNRKLRQALNAEFGKSLNALQGQFGINVSCLEKKPGDASERNGIHPDQTDDVPEADEAAVNEIEHAETEELLSAEEIDTVPGMLETQPEAVMQPVNPNFGAFMKEFVEGDLKEFVERGVKNYLRARYVDFLGFVVNDAERHSAAEVQSLRRLQLSILAAAQRKVTDAAQAGFVSLDEFKQSLIAAVDAEIPEQMHPETTSLFRSWFVEFCQLEFAEFTMDDLYDRLTENQQNEVALGKEQICRILMPKKFQAGNDAVSVQELQLLREKNPHGKKGKNWKLHVRSYKTALNDGFNGGYPLRDDETIEKMLQIIRNGHCEGLQVIGAAAVATPKTEHPSAAVPAATTDASPEEILSQELATPVQTQASVPAPEPAIVDGEGSAPLILAAQAETLIVPAPATETPMVAPTAGVEAALTYEQLVENYIEGRVSKLVNRTLTARDLVHIQAGALGLATSDKPMPQSERSRVCLLVELSTEAAIIQDLLHDLQSDTSTVEDLEEIILENAYPGGEMWQWKSLRTLLTAYAQGSQQFSVRKHVTNRMQGFVPLETRHESTQVPVAQKTVPDNVPEDISIAAKKDVAIPTPAILESASDVAAPSETEALTSSEATHSTAAIPAPLEEISEPIPVPATTVPVEEATVTAPVAILEPAPVPPEVPAQTTVILPGDSVIPHSGEATEPESVVPPTPGLPAAAETATDVTASMHALQVMTVPDADSPRYDIVIPAPIDVYEPAIEFPIIPESAAVSAPETKEQSADILALLLFRQNLVAKVLQCQQMLNPSPEAFAEPASAIKTLGEERGKLESDVFDCVSQIQESGTKHLAQRIVCTGELQRKQPDDVRAMIVRLQKGMELLERHKELTRRILDWAGRLDAARRQAQSVLSNAKSAIGEIGRLKSFLSPSKPADLLGIELGAIVDAPEVALQARAQADAIERDLHALSEEFQSIREEHASVCPDPEDYRKYSIDDVVTLVQKALDLGEKHLLRLSPSIPRPVVPSAGASTEKVAGSNGAMHHIPQPKPPIGAETSPEPEYVVSRATIVTATYRTGKAKREIPLIDLQRRLVLMITYSRFNAVPSSTHGLSVQKLREYWKEFYGAPVPSPKQIHDALDLEELTYKYKDLHTFERPPKVSERKSETLLLRYRSSRGGGKSGNIVYLPNDNTFHAVAAFPEHLKDDDHIRKIAESKRARDKIFKHQKQARSLVIAWAQTADVDLDAGQIEKQVLEILTPHLESDADALKSTLRRCIKEIRKAFAERKAGGKGK